MHISPHDLRAKYHQRYAGYLPVFRAATRYRSIYAPLRILRLLFLAMAPFRGFFDAWASSATHDAAAAAISTLVAFRPTMAYLMSYLATSLPFDYLPLSVCVISGIWQVQGLGFLQFASTFHWRHLGPLSMPESPPPALCFPTGVPRLLSRGPQLRRTALRRLPLPHYPVVEIRPSSFSPMIPYGACVVSSLYHLDIDWTSRPTAHLPLVG